MATIPRNRQIHKRLLIGRPDGQTWVDVADYLTSIEIELGSIEQLGTGTGTDIGVRSATFELRNVPGKRFAPRDKTSPWNLLNGEWAPLLWPYREVVFQTAVTAPGVSPAPQDWITIFEGYMGDSIVTESHKVTVSLRDKSKLLQDTYIDVKKTYEGPISAEDLIQAIINDYITDAPPRLYCPVPSGITFEEMTVEYVSVWDAIQNVAKQIGWYLGYRWNGVQYVLAFIEPPRDKTTHDFELDWEDVILNESLDIGDSEIRNALTITFRDASTGEPVTLRYTDYPQLRNEASISEYRLRAMEITEKETSLIDSVDKALRFGELCIWDLSELSATNRITLPFMPEVDVFSTLRVTNPLVSSTSDFYAVQSVRHTLRFGDSPSFRTEVIATGRVVGARKRWLDMETRPGRPGHPSNQGPPGPPGEVQVPKPLNPVWSDYTLTNTLNLRWRRAEFASGYEIRTDLNWGELEGMIFRGYAHSFSFTPTEREMILYLRALNAIGEYSEGYDTLHVSLPAPQAPQQPTVEAFFNALRISPTPLNSPSVMGYYVYVTGDGIDDKLAINAGGSLTYPLPSGTTVTIQVSAYDVIGEGGKSEPLQATTTALSELDIPDNIIDETKLTESLRQAIEENDLGDIPHRLEIVEAELDEEIEGSVKSQVLQLANEITLKVQRKTNGELVVTGIGVAIDDQGESEVAVLADRFKILGDVEGESQPVFAVDTQTQKIYILGDLIAEGLIRAKEVQAEVIKTLLLQAELAFVDDANVLRLRADKIIVGGSTRSALSVTKPEGGKLWHFDHSLHSTDGIKPLGGAVATLRPNEGRFGGAVAVEEGTTNLFSHPNDLAHSSWYRAGLASVTQVEPPPGLATAWRLVENDTNNYHRLLDNATFEEGETYTYSVYARGGGGRNLTIQGFNALGVPIARFDLDVGEVFYQQNAVGRIEPVGDGWYRCSMTFTMNEPTASSTVYFGLIQGRPTQTGAPLYRGDGVSYLDLSSPQKELKPFATSFVDGTRAAGFLAFPMPVGKNTGTISLWIRPQTLYFPSGANWGGRIDLSWGRSNPNSGFVIQRYQNAIQLRIWDGVSGTNIRTSINYDVGDWIHCAITWDAPSISFFVNGEFVGVLDREIDPDDRLVIGGASFGGSYNPGNALYDELLILPYAATEEEIKAWYEMNAPFYDPASTIAYQGQGGWIEIDNRGQRFYRHGQAEPTIEFDLQTGDGIFTGAVRAESIIIPVREA